MHLEFTKPRQARRDTITFCDENWHRLLSVHISSIRRKVNANSASAHSRSDPDRCAGAHERIDDNTWHELLLAIAVCPTDRLAAGEREFSEVPPECALCLGSQLLYVFRIPTRTILDLEGLPRVRYARGLDGGQVVLSEPRLLHYLEGTPSLRPREVKLGGTSNDSPPWRAA